MTLNELCSQVLSGKTVSLVYKKGQIILPVTKENIRSITNHDGKVTEVNLNEGKLDQEWFKTTNKDYIGCMFKEYNNYEYELKENN